jgi:hypothetical protein
MFFWGQRRREEKYVNHKAHKEKPDAKTFVFFVGFVV